MTTFKCDGFKVKLVPLGNTFCISQSGAVPAEVKSGISELLNATPRPDMVVAKTLLKSICRKSLKEIVQE